jgi:hypothetical protein
MMYDGMACRTEFKTAHVYGSQFVITCDASATLLDYWVRYFRPLHANEKVRISLLCVYALIVCITSLETFCSSILVAGNVGNWGLV